MCLAHLEPFRQDSPPSFWHMSLGMHLWHKMTSMAHLFGFQHPGSSCQAWVGFKRRKPLALKNPGWHALLGPLLGVAASLCCLLIGQFILLDTPYILEIDLSSQALLIQLLGHLGLGLELNALQVAGWMGFLLSSLQLLPIGATDGGQVLRTLMPRIHLPVSLMTLFALTLFAFSLPMKIAMTWWVWAGFSVLHLFGNPVKAPQVQRGLGNQLLLASLWLPLLIGLTQVSHLAIPEPVIPEADVSRKVEL